MKMTAEDFYKTQWTYPEKMDEFYKVGIRFSYNDMIKFANDYHETNIKNLNFSDETLIELAKNNCMLHRTSDELGFLVTFDLNDLRQFCTKLLKNNVI